MNSKRKVKVAFQGLEGAYSNMACLECFPNGKPVPCNSFEEMLEITKKQKTDYAMVPIENSVAGRVADIHNLLPKSGLFIVGEHFQKVNHQLLAMPGTKLEQIKYVKSHAQGIAQCRKFIKKYKLQAIQHIDTAGAAFEISKEKNHRIAAIASKMAGKIYGLEIIHKNIEDASHNTTRFLIMSIKPNIPKKNKNRIVTTIIFDVRSVPAALYKVLGGFATNGINLTKLESYTGGKKMNSARFYVDAEAHLESNEMKNALDEMKYYTMPNSIKILGSYVRDQSFKI